MPTDSSCPRIIRIHRYSALALAALLGLLSSTAAVNAQEQHAPFAPPGDTLATPGPPARNLSPKLDRRDLAKAIKLVADWQLGRMPAEPQVDWTWAALYTGFMAVPDKIAGDKYKQAMLTSANNSSGSPVRA